MKRSRKIRSINKGKRSIKGVKRETFQRFVSELLAEIVSKVILSR
jgi:hypothetical protein